MNCLNCCSWFRSNTPPPAARPEQAAETPLLRQDPVLRQDLVLSFGKTGGNDNHGAMSVFERVSHELAQFLPDTKRRLSVDNLHRLSNTCAETTPGSQLVEEWRRTCSVVEVDDTEPRGPNIKALQTSLPDDVPNQPDSPGRSIIDQERVRQIDEHYRYVIERSGKEEHSLLPSTVHEIVREHLQQEDWRRLSIITPSANPVDAYYDES